MSTSHTVWCIQLCPAISEGLGAWRQWYNNKGAGKWQCGWNLDKLGTEASWTSNNGNFSTRLYCGWRCELRHWERSLGKSEIELPRGTGLNFLCVSWVWMASFLTFLRGALVEGSVCRLQNHLLCFASNDIILFFRCVEISPGCVHARLLRLIF